MKGRGAAVTRAGWLINTMYACTYVGALKFYLVLVQGHFLDVVSIRLVARTSTRCGCKAAK